MQSKEVDNENDFDNMLAQTESMTRSESKFATTVIFIYYAFAYKSDILLVDEPFKGLDIVLTEKLTSLMSEMLNKSPKTVVYVTHNIGEALLVADRIIVLSSAPAKVAYDVKVETDKKSRTLSDKDLFKIRNEVYEALKVNSGV